MPQNDLLSVGKKLTNGLYDIAYAQYADDLINKARDEGKNLSVVSRNGRTMLKISNRKSAFVEAVKSFFGVQSRAERNVSLFRNSLPLYIAANNSSPANSLSRELNSHPANQVMEHSNPSSGIRTGRLDEEGLEDLSPGYSRVGVDGAGKTVLISESDSSQNAVEDARALSEPIYAKVAQKSARNFSVDEEAPPLPPRGGLVEGSSSDLSPTESDVQIAKQFNKSQVDGQEESAPKSSEEMKAAESDEEDFEDLSPGYSRVGVDGAGKTVLINESASSQNAVEDARTLSEPIYAKIKPKAERSSLPDEGDAPPLPPRQGLDEEDAPESINEEGFSDQVDLEERFEELVSESNGKEDLEIKTKPGLPKSKIPVARYRTKQDVIAALEKRDQARSLSALRRIPIPGNNPNEFNELENILKFDDYMPNSYIPFAQKVRAKASAELDLDEPVTLGPVPTSFSLIDEKNVVIVSKALQKALDLRDHNAIESRLRRLQSQDLVDECRDLEKKYFSVFGQLYSRSNCSVSPKKVAQTAEENLKRIENFYNKLACLDEIEGLYESLSDLSKIKVDPRIDEEELISQKVHEEAYKGGYKPKTNAEKAIWKSEQRLVAHFESRLRALKRDEGFEKEYLMMQDHAKWINDDASRPVPKLQKGSTGNPKDQLKQIDEEVQLLIDSETAKRYSERMPDTPKNDPEVESLTTQYAQDYLKDIRAEYRELRPIEGSRIPLASKRFSAKDRVQKSWDLKGSKIPLANQNVQLRIADRIQSFSGKVQAFVEVEIRFKKLGRIEPESWQYRDPNAKPKKPPKPPNNPGSGGGRVKQKPARQLALA
jgi:hypothetical protein